MTRISVVTISYNQADYLERALRSVLRQSGVQVEYIVVDPGSIDGSREIIERHRADLAAVIYDRDSGPADGLNRGLAAATGEYFYYLNSDDEVLDGAFLEAVSAFERNRSADVVYGNGIAIDGEDRFLRKIYSAPYMNAELYARGLAVVIQQSTFFKTDSLRAIGGFNIENRTCWDGEALFELARRGARFHREWATWGAFRIHEGSITGSGRLEAAYERDQQRMRDLIYPRADTLVWRAQTAALHATTRALDWRRNLDRIRWPKRPR